ncbi:MAG: hypothetical protein WCA76_13210 [Candidatus Sulfotelmatobacter sp.]|jgi:hypothetical protein
MRDNHDGCPELLDAYEREGLYFGSIRLTIADEVAAFEFGVEQRGYVSLKQILQTRPFDALGRHRYFFTGSFSKREPTSDIVRFDVRIEQGANGQNFKNFSGPVSLVSNLLWFQSLDNFQDAAALKRLS